MTIAIVGGTGTLGRRVAAELEARGNQVRPLSRHAPEYRVDLATGDGLGPALAGCARDDGLRGLAEVGARMTAAGDPDGGDALAQAFEAQRPRLVRVAYATVGSVAEAEDCVQEAWLRLRQVQDPAEIRDLGAWLTTTVGRLPDRVCSPARIG